MTRTVLRIKVVDAMHPVWVTKNDLDYPASRKAVVDDTGTLYCTDADEAEFRAKHGVTT